MKKVCFALLFLFFSCQSEKKVVKKYENGNPELVYVVNPSGDVKEEKGYHYNNVRSYEVGIEQGEREGDYESWSSNGTLKETGSYAKGLKTSTWVEWYNEKFPMKKGLYKDGLKEGEWVEFWFDKKIKKKEEYRKGELIGEWQEFFTSGKLKQKSSCNGKEKGIWTINNSSGKRVEEWQCMGSVRHGVYKSWDDIGKLSLKGGYRDGKKHGRWESYFANGNIYRVEEWKKGKREGVQRQIKKDSTLILEADLVNGEGHLMYRCPERSICSDSSFSSGVLHGDTWYWQKEKLIQENWKQGALKKRSSHRVLKQDTLLVSWGFFENEKPHGEWVVYHLNGKVSREFSYKKGELYGPELIRDSTGKAIMRKNHKGRRNQVRVDILDSASFFKIRKRE